MALAAKIAAKPYATVRTGKHAFYQQLEMPLAEAYDYAAQVMTENMLHAEAEEGIGAFLEKRAAEVASEVMPNYPDTLIKSILRSVKTIAMVGASGNSIRPSYFAMMYLLNKGYKIIPVNPGMAGKEILGQKVYASLKDVPAPVDMVDIFRESKYAPDIVREALAEKDRLGFKIIWMQLGVISEEAEKLAQGCRPHRHHGPLPQDRAWPFFRRAGLDGHQPPRHRQPQAASVRQRRKPQAPIGAAHGRLWFQHPERSCRGPARSRHRGAGDADLPDHRLRL